MQTKAASLSEAMTNTVSAILLSLISYQFILGPVLGLEVTFSDNLVLTGYFTALSFIRLYVIRRIYTTWRAKKDANL